MNRLKSLKLPKSDMFFTATGALLIATAVGMSGVLHPHQARAETALAISAVKDIPVLPPVRVVAAAGTTASDAATDRAGMRDRVRERIQKRMDEHAKAHPPVDKHLTSEQVRDIVAGRIAMRGNSNLKVGKVTAKAEGVVAVDIVTKSGALVETREISTKTGRPAKMEKAMAERRHFGRGHGRMHERMTGRHGMGARFGGDHKRDLALTVDQAKTLAEARLIRMGNPNLKVGPVKEKDADTISVDIVASDNSLVAQHLIDRHTGRRQRS